MATKIYGWRAPKLYIEEWMETVPGLDRLRLAQRMGVSPGTITKKLDEPEKIDQIWMAGFADALGLDNFLDLYRNPKAPTPSELLDGLSAEERKEVAIFADYVRSRKKAS